jgi:hypothetical protein
VFLADSEFEILEETVMAFKKSEKRANAYKPQCVTLIIDNSNSMAEKGKAEQVTSAVQDMVITMQSMNIGTKGFRFLLNLCSFGDSCHALAVAATPSEVDVDKLVFRGDAGGTEIAPALEWAAGGVKKALERCRKISNYQEEQAPNPICVFLSDAENTGGDVTAAANALRSIPFKNGCVDVFAVGVGMQDEHFKTMTAIASRPEYAIRIDPEGIAEFLAEVHGTLVESSDVARLAAKR